MDTRIAESRNRSTPKGRTIGESLKEVIFTSHTSPPKLIGFYTEIMLTTVNLIVKFIISIEKIGFPARVILRCWESREAVLGSLNSWHALRPGRIPPPFGGRVCCAIVNCPRT